MDFFITARAKALLSLNDRLDWLAPLLMRLYFGYFWLETGWAKLHNLDGFSTRFVDWGIPFPHFSATLSAGTEFVGGLLLMLGLLTRLTMLPMIFNMIVALAVVVVPNLQGADTFFEVDEPLYALIFFWFLMAGPGRVSLDHLLFGRGSGVRSANRAAMA